MNKTIAFEWIKALRSGKYKQAKGAMRVKQKDGSYAYCCLGVLRHGVLGKKNAALDSNGNKIEVLSSRDVKDCELISYNPYIEEEELRLSELNDNGKSFKYIANLIKKTGRNYKCVKWLV